MFADCGGKFGSSGRLSVVTLTGRRLPLSLPACSYSFRAPNFLRKARAPRPDRARDTPVPRNACFKMQCDNTAPPPDLRSNVRNTYYNKKRDKNVNAMLLFMDLL